MLLTFIFRLVIYRPLLGLTESSTDSVICDTVDESAKGGVVWYGLAGDYVTHSGTCIDNNRIMHLLGGGEALRSDRKGFMVKLNGLNPTMSVYIDCQERLPVGSITAAGQTLHVLGSRRQYHLPRENCHRFTAECLTRRPDNTVVLHRQLK